MSVHEGHRERMRRQMKTSGMDSLSDVQVLEVALYYAIARRDTNEIAHAAFAVQREDADAQQHQHRRDISPRAELLKIDGVGESAADLLLLFIQMERRHLMDRAGRQTILDTTYKCAQYLMPRFIGEQEEVVYLLCLDAKCKALDCSLIHRGAVNMTAISVRKIVKAALDHNATSVVVAHNHPSGLALPSREDRATTLALKAALDAVDVVLVDHVIVADEDFVSLADDGLL